MGASKQFRSIDGNYKKPSYNNNSSYKGNKPKYNNTNGNVKPNYNSKENKNFKPNNPNYKGNKGKPNKFNKKTMVKQVPKGVKMTVREALNKLRAIVAKIDKKEARTDLLYKTTKNSLSDIEKQLPTLNQNRINKIKELYIKKIKLLESLNRYNHVTKTKNGLSIYANLEFINYLKSQIAIAERSLREPLVIKDSNKRKLYLRNIFNEDVNTTQVVEDKLNKLKSELKDLEDEIAYLNKTRYIYVDL